MNKNSIQIRLQEIGDAKRFFEILSNPNFIFLSSKIASVEAEIEFIKNFYTNFVKSCYNFTIVYNDMVVGAIGVNYISSGTGRVGYFVDEKYWNNGIATQALKLIEQKCFKDLNLKKIILLIDKENISSERVAIKSDYKKEGTINKSHYGKHDMFIYAKLNLHKDIKLA